MFHACKRNWKPSGRRMFFLLTNDVTWTYVQIYCLLTLTESNLVNYLSLISFAQSQWCQPTWRIANRPFARIASVPFCTFSECILLLLKFYRWKSWFCWWYKYHIGIGYAQFGALVSAVKLMICWSRQSTNRKWNAVDWNAHTNWVLYVRISWAVFEPLHYSPTNE